MKQHPDAALAAPHNPRNGPPPGSDRRGDERLAADLAASDVHRCPHCGADMERREYQPAEPEVGARELPSGWDCGCGHHADDPTPAEDEDARQEAEVDRVLEERAAERELDKAANDEPLAHNEGADFDDDDDDDDEFDDDSDDEDDDEFADDDEDDDEEDDDDEFVAPGTGENGGAPC